MDHSVAKCISPSSPGLRQRFAEVQAALASLRQEKRALRQKHRRLISVGSGDQQNLAIACILERTPLAEHQAVAETFRQQQ